MCRSLRRTGSVILIILLCFSLGLPNGCARERDLPIPPVGKKVSNDLKDYRKYNRYVSDVLGRYFVGVFPEEIPLRTETDYSYYYSCFFFRRSFIFNCPEGWISKS